MGFLLAGAAVWLFYVLAGQVPAERVAFSQLLVLAVALAIWLAHRTRAVRRSGHLGGGGHRGRDRRRRGARRRRTRERGPDLLEFTGRRRRRCRSQARLAALEPGLAEKLAAEGRTVFVDVTADWCFTCKVNERLVLDTEPIAAGFAARGVIALKADWTNRDDRIAAYLASFGKYGIPFYAVYRPGSPPQTLPEVLTREIVLEAFGPAAHPPEATP